jgi:enamine deaminase RidA (YjgF/YER057c/UK114 family)
MSVQRFDLFNGAMGFSLAAVHNGTVWVTGMVGVGPDFTTVPDTVEEQLRNAYAHIATILTSVNSSVASIIDQTIYFVGDAGAATSAWDSVRTELFGVDLPTVTMIGVERLTDDRFRIEVKVVAAVIGE